MQWIHIYNNYWFFRSFWIIVQYFQTEIHSILANWVVYICVGLSLNICHVNIIRTIQFLVESPIYLFTVMFCVQSHKQVCFCQTQPFIILLNTTCFDQKLIILRCFNTKGKKEYITSLDLINILQLACKSWRCVK
jgi:hypothetical protein